MSKFPITNDVRSELTQAIDSSQTTMRVAKSISPFRQIPAIGGGELHLTIVDNLADVAKIEIVNVTAISDETSYWQLTIERGAEGTSSYAFDAGAPVFLAITQEAYHAKADEDDLGTAAYEDVTTSSTDTTSGRVTRVGDGGLLSANPLIYSDLNNAGGITQFFRIDSSAANSPFSGTGVGVNMARLSNRNLQLVGQASGSDPRVYYREQGAGDAWTDWVELYHTGNLDPLEVGDFGFGALSDDVYNVPDLATEEALDKVQFYRSSSGANTMFEVFGGGIVIPGHFAGTRSLVWFATPFSDDDADQGVFFAKYRDDTIGFRDPLELWHSGSKQINSQHFRQTAIHAHGNTSGAKTIALADGNYQTMTLTGNSTFSFTAPPGPCSCNILITNSGAGNEITLPGGVVFETGAQNTADGAKYVLTIIYDGTDYWVSWAT